MSYHLIYVYISIIQINHFNNNKDISLRISYLVLIDWQILFIFSFSKEPVWFYRIIKLISFICLDWSHMS